MNFKRFSVFAVLFLMLGSTLGGFFIFFVDFAFADCCSPKEKQCKDPNSLYGTSGGCGIDLNCGCSACCDDWYPGNCGEEKCNSDERYYSRTCSVSGTGCSTSKCEPSCSCRQDECDSDADCDDNNPCTTDTCNDPDLQCSTCSHSNKADGTDCGNCRECDGSGTCQYQCDGTESSCECISDSCIDCSDYYGTSCGYGNCADDKRPSWSCSSGRCTYSCSHSSSCACTSYTSQTACEENNCYWCDKCSGSETVTGSRCRSSSSDCQYSCVAGSCGAVCCDDTDCQNRCNEPCSSTGVCNSDYSCSYPDCPSEDTGELCSNDVDDDCDGAIDCADGDCADTLPCAPGCGAGYTSCHSYITSEGGSCPDPVEGPVAGTGCCWNFSHTVGSGSVTYCCYDNYDDTKETCNPYCSYNENTHKWRWIHNIPNKCDTGGWQCDYANADIDTCTGSGSGCCDVNCTDATGCGLSPNDANCDPGYKCDGTGEVTGTSCTCYWPACEVNSECPDGYCCQYEVGGSKTCVAEGSTYGSGKYLCDPPGWTSDEEQTDQKNIFELILDFLYQSFIQR